MCEGKGPLSVVGSFREIDLVLISGENSSNSESEAETGSNLTGFWGEGWMADTRIYNHNQLDRPRDSSQRKERQEGKMDENVNIPFFQMLQHVHLERHCFSTGKIPVLVHFPYFLHGYGETSS